MRLLLTRGAEQVTQTPDWGPVLGVLLAQVGAVRREIVRPLGTQSIEVSRACQGDFCKGKHSSDLLAETLNGGVTEGDVPAQQSAPTPKKGRNGSEIKTRGTVSLQEVGQCPEPRTLPLAMPCRVGSL